MYIKSIIIDGFKSYAQRTEINGFDPLFNAITGLNGSGKSNILDSICFLLGISNLSQVRASNLQDLVYKNGQAGITKATVSITFDNSDKKQSPLGFETHDEITVSRQVIIGGRNKYLINGVNANNTRVHDLFCSVGLNVNNPHFLIMQGRITKVLNMKPMEILSLIEEAAGTSMYECKKLAAQKTIEKKEAKLKEIHMILEEEITPTLQKLKEERSSYLEFQKIIREIEHLTRLYVAYQFVCAEETKLRSAEDLKKMQDSIVGFKETITKNEKKVKEISKEVSELEKIRDKEVGGVLQALEQAVANAHRMDAKVQSTLDSKKDSLKAEEKKQKTLVKSMEEDGNALAAKEKEVKKISDELHSLEETSQKDDKALVIAQQHFNAVSAGLSSNEDGEAATLAGQMMACKNDISKAETEAKQAQMKLKHAQQEYKSKQAEAKKVDNGYKKIQEAFEAVKKNREKIEAELQKMNYEDGKEEKLLEQRRELSQTVNKLRESYESLVVKFPSLRFDYKDPEKNWDSDRVKGLVATLLSVKDVSTATALEVVAGGRLYNVVVDTEVTGKKLLEKGELKRRYTIIPLNKISARCLNEGVVKAAKNLVGADNVHTALSLVGYEQELKKAMEYVFGTVLVCDCLENAKKVTFDPRIMTKTVTLGGDTFDPQGTLSGGARLQSASVLVELQKLKDIQVELKTKQNELQKVDKELGSLKNIAEGYRELKLQCELKSQEEELLLVKLQQSSYHRQQEELKSIQKTIAECEETLNNTKEVQKKIEEKYAVLENKMKNADAEREKELKEAQKKLDDAKKKADMSIKKTKEKKQEMDALLLELEAMKNERTGYEEQIGAVEAAIKSYKEQIENMAEEVANNKESVKMAQDKLAMQKEAIKSQNKDIQIKNNSISDLLKQKNDAQLKIQELEHNITKHKSETADAAAKVTKMQKEYEWINSEKHLFGQTNTVYDFKTNCPKEAGRQLKELQEKKNKLGKNLNMRAMNMLSQAEERYNDLMKKKKIVTNDKSKILSTIEELDKKKNEALNVAWKQVNQDFGSIFSTLLPGSNAMLVPPEGKTIRDGVEFKVALGDAWKDNLTELSGGQRSLVALSLILAMLLFKPAPIYILDEVDAALDLSHTQNIGQMLRTHFQHSQFIVVSLKDGMFSNANILFKTKFMDGVSIVTRFAQRQIGSATSNHLLGKPDNAKTKGKKKRLHI
ncbi:structural maintenance of chromosomes protein 2 isoform X1 [Rhinoraja longicauda]